MGSTQSQPKAENSTIDRLKRYSRADKLAAAFAGKSSKTSAASSVQQEEIRVTAEQRAVDDDTESQKGTAGYRQQGAVEEDHRVLYQTGHDKVPVSGCVHTLILNQLSSSLPFPPVISTPCLPQSHAR